MNFQIKIQYWPNPSFTLQQKFPLICVVSPNYWKFIRTWNFKISKKIQNYSIIKSRAQKTKKETIINLFCLVVWCDKKAYTNRVPVTGRVKKPLFVQYGLISVYFLKKENTHTDPVTFSLSLYNINLFNIVTNNNWVVTLFSLFFLSLSLV